MPGCVAVGCSNNDKKGFLMRRFPQDPDRRKIWAAKVRRKDWIPKDTSYLCEVHFTADMWETNRCDGKRKLKWNAIPTLFTHFPVKKARKPPLQRSSVLLTPGKNRKPCTTNPDEVYL